jgi:hypothetical protein
MEIYEGVSKSFRTGLLEQEQIVQLSTARCRGIAILSVSLVSCAAVTLCIVTQQVLIFVDYFFIDSVQKILDTSS